MRRRRLLPKPHDDSVREEKCFRNLSSDRFGECGCSNFAGVTYPAWGEMIAMTFLMFFDGTAFEKRLFSSVQVRCAGRVELSRNGGLPIALVICGRQFVAMRKRLRTKWKAALLLFIVLALQA